MNQNSDKIKIALLVIIAITLIIQTFYLSQDKTASYADVNSGTPAKSNMIAEPTSDAPAVTDPAAPTGPTTSVKFAETEHDFGKIMQESDNKKVFKFTNTGTIPLTIANAVGSCGCTVPTWPKEPIAPGKTGVIEVVYKPGQQKGSQSKTVTITANTEPLTTMLFIRADVQEKK